MTKIFVILTLTSLFGRFTYAQTISPNEATEFCPNVNVVFTVTLPRILDNTTPNVFSYTNTPVLVSGVTNLSHSPSQTTFQFTGKFIDVNIAQAFRVTYQTTSDPSGTKDFIFRKIKSLSFANTTSSTCLPLIINTAPLSFPRCEVVNRNISFNNIQWNTYAENPAYCFGTITAYEYQLPNGWSIGQSNSTGSNWIVANNSVTITSDLANGVNGVIRIRPSNNCATGLANNQPQVIIGINRSEPSLSITGNQYTICSGCETFTINGMPSGATVQWSLSSTDATISGSSTSQSVSICRNSSSNTVVTLTATVSHCSFTYPVNKNISLGSPSFIGTSYFSGTYSTLSTWNSFSGTGAGHVLLDGSLGYTSYNWSLYSGTVSSWTQNNSYPSGQRLDFDIGPYGQYGDQFAFTLSATNSCGTIEETYYFYYYGNYYRMVTYPNPATDFIKIEFPRKIKNLSPQISIQQIQIIDKMGNIKNFKKYGKGLNSIILWVGDLPNDIYTLRVFNGKVWTSEKIVIKR